MSEVEDLNTRLAFKDQRIRALEHVIGLMRIEVSEANNRYDNRLRAAIDKSDEHHAAMMLMKADAARYGYLRIYGFSDIPPTLRKAHLDKFLDAKMIIDRATILHA